MASAFGPIRSVIWPVHRSEVKKVLSMLLLLLLLCISYSILRNLKDAVVLTASDSGAEVIPFLKVWGMLPAAIIATWFYARLANRMTREKVFYTLISCFLIYFLAFAFIIFPNRDQLNLVGASHWLTEYLPSGFKGLIAFICNWTFTTFYVVCELWSVMTLSILFWGFANEITPLSQAKRHYGIFNIGSNMAPILGGFLALALSKGSWVSGASDQWEQTLVNLILLVTVVGCLSMVLFYWIHRNIDQTTTEPTKASTKKKKIKISLRESIRYISGSKYLLCIAMLVLGFNIAINMTDVLWKQQLKTYFTDPSELLNHMNQVTVGIGTLASIGAALFSIIVCRLGWTFVGLITPLVMSVMGAFFFSFLFFGDSLSGFSMMLFGMSPLALTVYFGSLQNCLSKASKYSVFDASKELAFLPLSSDARVKGKAAIDGLGSGVGKSGASIVYQALILLVGGISQSTPFIAGLLLIVLAAWFIAVVSLGKRFKAITETQKDHSAIVGEESGSLSQDLPEKEKDRELEPV